MYFWVKNKVFWGKKLPKMLLLKAQVSSRVYIFHFTGFPFSISGYFPPYTARNGGSIFQLPRSLTCNTMENFIFQMVLNLTVFALIKFAV